MILRLPTAWNCLLLLAAAAPAAGLPNASPEGNAADLAIETLLDVAIGVPGLPMTYTLVVSNAGPGVSSPAHVGTSFAGPLACSTTSVASAGVTGHDPGPIAGGFFDGGITLTAGATLTYTAVCQLDPATLAGALSSNARVGSETPDPMMANNQDGITVLVDPLAEISISNSDGTTTAQPGDTLTYTAVATNTGPSYAYRVGITYVFPPELEGCTTTSVAAGGATGNDPGPVAGNFSAVGIALPIGATVTYTATCTIAEDAAGTFETVASILSASAADPELGNNIAVDATTAAPLAGVAEVPTLGQLGVLLLAAALLGAGISLLGKR